MNETSSVAPQPEETIDLFSYIRIFFLYRWPILRLALFVTLCVLATQIFWYRILPVNQIRQRSQELVRIGIVNGEPIADIKPTLSLLATEFEQERVLKTLQLRDPRFGQYERLPTNTFDIAPVNDAIFIISASSSEQGMDESLLGVLSDQLIGDNAKLYTKKIADFDDQMKEIKDQIDTLSKKVESYQKRLDSIDQTISQLSPSNSANSQALDGFLLARFNTASKLEDFQGRLFGLQLSQKDLQIKRREVTPTTTEIIKLKPRAKRLSEIGLSSLSAFPITLAFGAFGALFLEWWRHNKHRLNSNL